MTLMVSSTGCVRSPISLLEKVTSENVHLQSAIPYLDPSRPYPLQKENVALVNYPVHHRLLKVHSPLLDSSKRNRSLGDQTRVGPDHSDFQRFSHPPDPTNIAREKVSIPNKISTEKVPSRCSSTHPAKPTSVSLAFSKTSSSVLNLTSAAIGPKVSSFRQSADSGTSPRMVAE
jgi:hypothetical protein